MTVEPTRDRLLIKACAAKAISDGGIHIPDSMKNPSNEAIVIAVGPECKDAKKKDRVILSGFGGVKVKVDNEDMMVIEEESILAIVKS